MHLEAKLQELGLILPEPMQVPSGLQLPFSWVRVRANRAYISGHIPLNEDGSIAHPLGKVGAEVSAEEGHQAARRVALAHLGSLKRALGDLDHITAWLRVFAMVNVAPDFDDTPAVIHGCSDLLLEVFGEAGRHARSAVGMTIPHNWAVEIEMIVEVK